MSKKKRPVGRPTKYQPILCQNIIDYFSTERIIYKDITITYKNGDTVDKTVPEAAPTPFFVDWQIRVGISDETMLRWVHKYPEFRGAYKRAKQLQEVFLRECAMKGVHNSVFTIFTMKNVCGWRDQHEIKGEGFASNDITQIFAGLTTEQLKKLAGSRNTQASPERVS